MPYVFPTSKSLQEIGPAKVARLSAVRRGLQIMPIRTVNEPIVRWKQKDNYTGLQQLRGLDGSPSYVSMIGEKVYQYNPGVYGEYNRIGETELTLRAGSVSTDVPIDVSDLVLEGQDNLIQRELDRIESINWTLITTGTFSISGPNGNVLFTDTFPLQTYNAAVTWATSATATPLADFRAIQLFGPGNGVNFGSGAVALMNRTTANAMLANKNNADLFGKWLPGSQTVNTIGDINRVLLGEDLPQIEIYDEGYYADPVGNNAPVFTRFIPNNKVAVVGQRPTGEVIGEYVQTRNLVNPNGSPGPYEFVVDRINGTNAEKRVPPSIEVHRGHNGGPVCYYPGSIVVMTV